MNTEDIYQLYLQHPIISTDTRKIVPGSLFFALKGDKFDANTFAEQAISQGAAYAIIDNPEYQLNEKYILVDDGLTTLQDLARYHRKQLTIPVIGLTGTNGKTTTKELINAVLSQKFKTLATQGNLNNHIGVPLTILSINSTHEMAVIEMGANHQKEIELLCSISQPTHGLITNIGKAHLEGFGGVEGIKKGKGELYDFLSREVRKSESPEAEDLAQGIAFVNGDDKVLMEMQRARDLKKVVMYGTNNRDNTIIGKLTENSPLLSLQWTNNSSGESHEIKTQLTGAYNLDNILAAICIGNYFGLDADTINKGVEGYEPQNNRSQIKQTATNTLICDYYNANPSSMFVAIENIGKLTADRKVLILGDMFELGDESAAEHEAIIRKALATDVDERIFIGKDFLAQKWKFKGDKLKNATFHATVENAITALKFHPVKNSTVLIKGSRGMALERLVELF
ncbi:UDP-N-acetylmuramoyl-tripeptide--D-alanyl-D-alanine ligase [Mucilaginibacter sp. X5P1]|uniref:UDP-N-acetylmuramoyl-tripeptide--D-alanyl-D- alanine ligase n=1 Tax=Mucilaginibacter sp. X5P1 TaxID=2723088 RepID=UPI0016145BA4|nr:UDP-N-acetylmuramoyl-tripeptide--D-alanyl-D-alanine ligase [Mucilaginibacter sp. X5P1]MBB6139951.1 UDP-N-acetylmuramoyl-tripeptide--D-alanyl-D-alanine ligase [Mucilaginibacter sp. X5P1]